jgi:hypothetical protein
MRMVCEVLEAATPATSLKLNSLARYICRYKPLRGRYAKRMGQRHRRLKPIA